MKEQTIAAIADLKLKVAEHIIAQDDYYKTTDVRRILTETKVGAQRRSGLLKKLKMIFLEAEIGQEFCDYKKGGLEM